MTEYRTSDGLRALIPLGVSEEIACSLENGLIAERVEDWKALLEEAEGRRALPDGVRVMFPRSADVAAISQLAAAEQNCCQFFSFGISIDRDSVSLDVTGPEAARPVIDSLFGVAS